MLNVLANIKGFKKIFSSSQDGYNENTFYEKCINHQHTIVLLNSNNGKILGGYSPMKWANFGPTQVAGG